MKKFEYKQLSRKLTDPLKVLNELGAQGWRLIDCDSLLLERETTTVNVVSMSMVDGIHRAKAGFNRVPCDPSDDGYTSSPSKEDNNEN